MIFIYFYETWSFFLEIDFYIKSDVNVVIKVLQELPNFNQMFLKNKNLLKFIRQTTLRCNFEFQFLIRLHV